MCGIFGWYMAVDTLPRKNWIPEYWAQLRAAVAQAPDLANFEPPQPVFFMDNPKVSVEPAENGYEVVLRQASERRCVQFSTVAAIRQSAQKITISGGSCNGDMNTVRIFMNTAPNNNAPVLPATN